MSLEGEIQEEYYEEKIIPRYIDAITRLHYLYKTISVRIVLSKEELQLQKDVVAEIEKLTEGRFTNQKSEIYPLYTSTTT